MDDNIISFPGVNTDELNIEVGNDLDIDSVLSGLDKESLTELIVIGRNADDDVYFATTSANPEKIMWDLERAKFILLNAYLT